MRTRARTTSRTSPSSSPPRSARDRRRIVGQLSTTQTAADYRIQLLRERRAATPRATARARACSAPPRSRRTSTGSPRSTRRSRPPSPPARRSPRRPPRRTAAPPSSARASRAGGAPGRHVHGQHDGPGRRRRGCNATHCSLTEAIFAANAAAGPNTIAFSVGSGPITISADVAAPHHRGPDGHRRHDAAGVRRPADRVPRRIAPRG